jgi:SAM-dependent methyltransferase
VSDLRTNFGAAAADYRRHRAGFPDSLFERLAQRGVGLAGQRVVDLGTGTGTLARGFARRGCRVVAIDPDARMLAEARSLDEEAGVKIDYRRARAEETGLDPSSADVVAAGQCWHWFDRAAAAREVTRLLRPEGFVVIAHFDWIPSTENVVEATEKLIESHNPRWKFGGGLGIYPRWLRDLAEADFRDIETFSYDLDVPYTPEGWRGRIRASAGVGAALDADGVARFDRDLAALLAERFPGKVLNVPHRVFAVMARRGRARA